MLTFAALAFLAGTLSGSGHTVMAGALTTVSPSGASPLVTINITGTGFNTTASSNEVAFIPATGPAVIVPGRSIVLVSAATGSRRLGVSVPAGLQPGRVTLRVTNTVTAESIEGLSFDIIGISLNEVSSAPRGASNSAIRITGTSNTRFVAGSSRAVFGAGITVHSTTVESATSLVASISIAATSALGPRNVSVISPTQTATIPSAFAVTDAGIPPNHAPNANAAGPYSVQAGVSFAFTGSGSDPDPGDSLAFSWTFGDGSEPVNGAQVSHAYTTAGTYTATLTVSDGRGGTATSTAQVTVAAAPPPNHNPSITSVPVTAATEGQPYSYDVNATDLDLNDVLSYTLVQSPAGMIVNGTTGAIAWTPSVAGQVPVTVRVSDGKGGSAEQSFTIATATANHPPVIVSAQVPAASEGQAFTFDIDATDDVGDTLTYELTQAPSGMSIDPSSGIIEWTPAAAHVPTVQVVVQVLDGRGGSATQSFTIDVIAAPPPNQQPVITSTPVTAATEGQPYTYDVNASDPDTGDTLTYTLTQAPSGMVVDPATGVISWLPSATPATAPVIVVVADGRTATATQSFTIVVAPAALGRGVITGWVFDDATGLPIPNASVQLLDGSGGPAAALPVNSDALGRYRLSVAAGAARVRVTKDGFTGADLAVTVVDGRRVEPDDARLTMLNPATPIVSSVAGGSVGHGGARATFAPGSFNDDRIVRLTEVGVQGGIRRLPLGWNPVAFVDVSAGNGVFATNAQLSARVIAAPLAGRDITLANWDHESGSWIAIGTATRSADGTSLEGEMSESGQYAFAVADAAPNAPPIAVAGSALTGLGPRPPPVLTLTLNPAPRILFAQSGARSLVSATATPLDPVPSGTPLQIDLTESFTFVDGSELRPMPGRRRLALYGAADVQSSALRASFGVAPSRALTPFSVREGAIDLAGRLPVDPFAPRGRVFGGQGGEFAAPTGERVIVPPGSSTEDLPIDLLPIAADDFPLPIPAGHTLLRSFVLDLHGASLTREVQVALPSTVSVPSGSAAMVVHLVDVGDATRLVLVAVATPQDAGLVTTIDPLGDGSVHLPGIRSEGRYAVLLATGNLGYVTGEVTDAEGAVLGGALVEGVNVPVAAMSDSSGRYTLLLPAGAVDLRVTNPANGDGALINTEVTGDFGVTNRPAPLAASPPAIVAVTPVNGATKVPLGSSVTVTFSEPIDPASVTSGALTVASSAGPVAGTLALAPGNIALTFRFAALLQSQTVYTLAVVPVIRDTAGHALASGFSSQFTTVDVTPPAPPPAGTVVASIPDTAGTATITGSQGTVDPGGVVIIRNLRNNALTTLTPNADGSFSGVLSALRTDRLEMTIRDAAGNETTVPVAAFRNADGAVIVGAAGGRVEGPGGAIADIPSGALPDGTVVRIEAIAADQFVAAPPSGFPFAGGIRIDLGGVVAAREIDISIPAPGDATSLDQVLVGHLVPHQGGQAWTVIERAHLENGRYQTASPPFLGVTFQGQYAFLRSQADCVSYVSIRYDFGFQYTITPTGFPFVYPSTEVQVVTFPASCNQQIDVAIQDPDTNVTIQQVSYLAPAARDDIAFPPDLLTDDHSRPALVSLNNPTGSEVEVIELRFSKRLDPNSVTAGFQVRDSQGQSVAGRIEMAELDSMIVFRPDLPFRLGEQYTILLSGVTDLAGNLVDAQPISFTPFGPRSLKQLKNVGSLLPYLEKCSVSSGCTTSALDVAYIGTTLFVANGVRRADEQYTDPANPRKLLAIDVRDPFNPSLIGWHETTTNPRVLATVKGAGFFTGSAVFSGDLLLVGGGGRDSSGERDGKLEIYDVTQCVRGPNLPNSNCLSDRLRGVKFLSTPSTHPPFDGVPPESGVPLQIATLHQPGQLPAGDTLLAYVLTVPIGIEVIDVPASFNYPLTPGSGERGPHGLLRGDFVDVAVLKNQVLAIGPASGSSGPRLVVFSGQLSQLRTIPPPVPPDMSGFAGAARVAPVENIVFDLDGDGRIGTPEDTDNDSLPARNELFDLAIVSSGPLTAGCVNVTPCGDLYVIDLSPDTALDHSGDVRVLERIPMPGSPFSVQVDVAERLAHVELRGRGIAIVDLNHLLPVVGGGSGVQGLLDANGDGVDDRILSVVATGGNQGDIALARIKIDFDRGIAFVNGGATGVELVQIANKSTELALDFRHEVEFRSRDKNRELREQRTLLKSIVDEAVIRLRRQPAQPVESGGIGDVQIAAVQQGSGSCFWREEFLGPEDGPSRSCAAFQPGTSDHDIEVFVPQPLVANAQKILNQLLEDRAEMLEPLGDLSLYAMPLEPFRDTELLVGTPLYGEGVSDPTGDLGMGRQTLMLLWLLEGEYVEGHQGGLPDLSILLDELRGKAPRAVIPGADQPSGIPRLEGFEWAVLQEYNANKTGARLRVKGACDAESIQDSHTADLDRLLNDPLKNFNEAGFLGADCKDEIHTVAKGAIRAVLARLVADQRSNPLILQINPDAPETQKRAAYRRDACFDGSYNSANLGDYQPVPCKGFEHYIASVAVRSVAANQGVFQAGDLPLIFDFYCAKVDCRPVVVNDAQADEFVWKSLRFIERVQNETRATFAQSVREDTKPIGAIPNLGEGPGGGPGIAGICQGQLAQHADLVQEFLGSDLIPASIDELTPRKFLRLCNYVIVTLKVDGDSTVDVPEALLETHLQRDESGLAELKRRLGVKNYVDWKLKVRALNLGGRQVRVNLALYDGNGSDPLDYKRLAILPPGLDPPPDDLGLLPVNLDPGETRVLSKAAVSGEESEAPLFPLLFNLQRPELAPGATRALAFYLDPERTVPEANKRDNQADLFYYVLPVGDLPPAVPPTPGNPVPPVQNVDPDPVALDRPRLEFDLILRRENEGSFYGGEVVSAGLYEDVYIKYVVKNLGASPLEHVQIVRDGMVVYEVPELAPGDDALFTDPSPFVPTEPGLHVIRAFAGAFDERMNKLAPVPDSATVNATEGIQRFKIGFFDASPLTDPQHPLSRFKTNHDEATHALDLRGAVTDGQGRIRIEIERLPLSPQATVTIVDGDLADVTDEIGGLESGDQVGLLTTTVTADSSGRAVLYYRPPATFVREPHEQDDLQKVERNVRLRVFLSGVGSTTRRIALRRPPVFLVHGLFSTRDSWAQFQPLVPSSGPGPTYVPFKGFDGRFDVFAVGNAFASGSVTQEALAVTEQIRMSLLAYLPRFALGGVDVIGHSVGGVVARVIANRFVAQQWPVPFRKLIAVDAPFQGSALFSKIADIRSKMPVELELFDRPKDLLDVVTSIEGEEGEEPVLAPEVKAKAEIATCAFMVQSLGMTPRFFTHGAVEDLQLGSPFVQQLVAAGIAVPSHHIATDTDVPELGIGIESEMLWGALGEFCNLTPDPSTTEATVLFKTGVQAAKTLLMFTKLMQGFKTAMPKLQFGPVEIGLTGISAGRKFPLLKVSDATEKFMKRVGPVAKFAKKQSSEGPTPVFPGENDRVVDTTSQGGGFSPSSLALTTMLSTDHTEVIESPGVTVGACGDLSSAPTPGDKNGDGVPDIGCRVIHLLEIAPTNPWFVKNQ